MRILAHTSENVDLNIFDFIQYLNQSNCHVFIKKNRGRGELTITRTPTSSLAIIYVVVVMEKI